MFSATGPPAPSALASNDFECFMSMLTFRDIDLLLLKLGTGFVIDVDGSSGWCDLRRAAGAISSNEMSVQTGRDGGERSKLIGTAHTDAVATIFYCVGADKRMVVVEFETGP